MRKKYIIELEDNQTAYSTTILGGTAYIKPLQTLSYTEPDLEQIRKEAYDKGYMAAHVKSHMETRGSYQQGLNDAWETARKIVLDEEDGGLDTAAYCEIFGYGKSFHAILKAFTASEAIAKIKEYEDSKQEIKVGDEVAFHNDDRPDTVVVVTHIGEDGFIDGMDGRGTQYAHKNPKRWTKTGRTFPEIAAVLEKMREGQEQ